MGIYRFWHRFLSRPARVANIFSLLPISLLIVHISDFAISRGMGLRIVIGDLDLFASGLGRKESRVNS